MSGGGGGETVVQPSTTTSVQDIPAWEQGYVTSLLGQAQTEAAQPYQQFPGQQIAGFTPDQTQAFSNVEGAGAQNEAAQNAAMGMAGQGADTANNIYGAGSPLINASTMAASPLGIQQYMSPYTNNVVQGIQNEANQNWNQNIMPGINNEFVGSGQGMSGRNAQVLGQAAGNFQTGLSSNIANALQSGYSTAGQQAATEAGLLGTAGSTLGNLANTQAGTQLSAGTQLGNIGAQSANTNLNQNEALQGVGQQQQQLNQTNLNTAQQNFENQVQYPEQQSQFLNQIIRGLPAPVASTSASQSPAYSVSPLTGIGGAGAGLAGLLSNTGKKEGGLIKGYAQGGDVDDDQDYDPSDMYNPLDYASNDNAPSPAEHLLSPDIPSDNAAPDDEMSLDAKMADAAATPTQDASPSKAPVNPLAPPIKEGITPEKTQQLQLLALARGLLTPQMNGSGMAALGAGFGNMADVSLKTMQMQQQQQQLNYENQMKQIASQQEQEKIDQGKYTPVKDFYGNVTGMVEGKTGKFTPVNTTQAGATASINQNEPPSDDPQKAAAQILSEQGSVPTQVGSRQDITGRNKQTDAYNSQALAAKNVIQQLNVLDSQTGKYTPGKVMGNVYGAESAVGMGGDSATARTEADKAATQLTNAFMSANTSSNRSGIGVLNFDAKGVPGPDMTDDARTALIEKQKAIANSQIQRAEISNLYPRMQIANVNSIMNTYEQKNPPLMPDGSANPNWMTYQDWLKAGRPNTAESTGGGTKASAQPSPSKQPSPLDALLAEKARRQGAQ